MDLSRRTDYVGEPLLESQIARDPVVQLRTWIEQAESTGLEEPNAIILATVDATGNPSARNVLLRGLDDHGLMQFFTNWESHKAHEIAANPNVSILFSWLSLKRQVRVTGYASMLSDAECDGYFASRPREAQIGAWASRQSTVISGREELEMLYDKMVERFGDGPVPRPPYWGGYSVTPTSFEFWQGRESRLHDRLYFWRHSDGWLMERLAP